MHHKSLMYDSMARAHRIYTQSILIYMPFRQENHILGYQATAWVVNYVHLKSFRSCEWQFNVRSSINVYSIMHSLYSCIHLKLDFNGFRAEFQCSIYGEKKMPVISLQYNRRLFCILYDSWVMMWHDCWYREGRSMKIIVFHPSAAATNEKETMKI